MKINLFIAVLLAFLYTGCKNQDHDHDDHDHDHDSEVSQDQESPATHNHGDVKLQLIAYSDQFEVFAEADPLVVGKKAHILAHFTMLPEFEALEEGIVSAKLIIDGQESSQTLEKPIRKGIYPFEVEPVVKGTGELLFDIKIAEESYRIIVHDVTVYDDNHDAIHAADDAEIHSDDGIVFTKEQSWRIDFATTEAKEEAFGEVIQSSARIKPSQGDEQTIVARTSGIVVLSDDQLLPGRKLRRGEELLIISGKNMADNNSEVRYREAKNNFEKAKADYERMMQLADDKIVSEKELLEAENLYKNASVNYEALKRSFSASGQNIISPISGYVNHMHISNGQYVEAGEALLSITQNQVLLLEAEVQQKYASVLDKIYDATIRTTHDGQSYTLEELNGEISEVGKSANDDNYLIPVHLQVDNTKHFVPGGFVEVFLKIRSEENSITIPNSALLEAQDNYSVIVQLTPELFEFRSVETGATDGIKTEIVKGVHAGERVVSQGAILMKLAQSTGTLDAHSGHVH